MKDITISLAIIAVCLTRFCDAYNNCPSTSQKTWVEVSNIDEPATSTPSSTSYDYGLIGIRKKCTKSFNYYLDDNYVSISMNCFVNGTESTETKETSYSTTHSASFTPSLSVSGVTLTASVGSVATTGAKITKEVTSAQFIDQEWKYWQQLCDYKLEVQRQDWWIILGWTDTGSPVSSKQTIGTTNKKSTANERCCGGAYDD